MSFPPPPAPNITPHHRHVSTGHILPPIAGATAALSLLTLLLLLFRRLFHHHHHHSLSSPPPHPLPFSLLRRATASFHPSRKLGQGGSGAVFSATLPNHRHVAVKLLDSGSLQSQRDFHNEIQLADKLARSDRVVKLLGFATSRRRRRHRMCLVYELMSNGSLQDCLLHRKCEELMEWSARVRVAVDVAKGLAFLHHACEPPVIHGDVKPSNVLLDQEFVAKIADFGLARLKLVDSGGIKHDEVVINVNDNIVDGNGSNCNGNEVGSVVETESVTTVGVEEGSVVVDQSPVRVLAVETSPEMVTAAASPSEFLEKGSDLEGQFDVSRSEGVKVGEGGGNGVGKVKEYVMEWMGMEVGKERVPSDWADGGGVTTTSDLEVEKVEKKKGKKKMEWWMSMDDVRVSKKEKRRPVREWWKDEFSEELAKKKKKKKKDKHQGAKSDNEENWWPRDDGMYADKNKKKSRSRRSSRSSVDWWLDGLSGDLWKGRHTSFDSMSGEIPKSGGISSTPSMRGTVCYIAPEYSMGGDLSEKCDVYSFGVLLLVIISGRRPLQVTGSPMSEFHKANLLSWARQLARSGKLLDLVDENIRSLNSEQAQLCITVALSCLQKSPARRPSMKEVVGMLTGELAPPELPVEYSPSPASKYRYRSRKKLR